MTTRRTVSRGGSILGVALIILAVLGGAAAWYALLRPSGPPPVSLGSTSPGSAAPAGSASPSAGASAGTASSAEHVLDGVWTTDPAASAVSGPATFVGYRVREELANIGTTEAVGRTSGVTGSLTIDGTTVTEGEITADLTALQSDSGNRDRQLARQALETAIYPEASFILTAPIDLGSVPAQGQVVEVTATGDLTLHGVTRSVQARLQARWDGDTIAVAGSVPIVFADFGIEKPQAMVVLSVEDGGTVELLIHLTRCCG